MKAVFKQLIIDFQRMQLPTPSLRAFQLPKLSDLVRKAYVFVGMRRSGKTWALYQQIQSLLQAGTKPEQILYLNFEDERLPNITSGDLQAILDAYFELYPQYINCPNVHFFFDEIQEITGWEKFIRRLLDTEKMEIYITGSSAKMLSKEIASTLRGRTIVREIFPFSFSEYLHYVYNAASVGNGKGFDDGSGDSFIDRHIINLKFPLATREQQIIKHHLQNFLHYGGFPEAVVSFSYTNFLRDSMLNNQFRELLQSYVNSAVQRDIVDRHHLKNSVLVKDVCNMCLKNSAKLFSVYKNYRDLKSQGRKVSKKSLYDLMNYFEDAYCIFSVPAYSFSSRKAAAAEKKIYPIDQGLVSAYTLKESFEESTRLETAVFSYLRRLNQEVYYYKTPAGKEVDFLTINAAGKQQLYQVVLNLNEPKTLLRETSALEEAMGKFKVQAGTIITLDDERDIEVASGKIQCLPIWKFLLGNELQY